MRFLLDIIVVVVTLAISLLNMRQQPFPHDFLNGK